MSALTRRTGETRVRVVLRTTSPEPVPPRVATGEPFLDHMLVTLARYSGVQLEVHATGDLRHHVIEDVAITVGMALRRETPGACARYGAATVPMDEALVQAALDLGGRFYYRGRLPSGLYEHFLRSFAEHAALTLHVRVMRGGQRHHVVEAAVKAVGLALRQALAPGGSVFSTKGAVEVAWEDE
jgi:imidazoleglycerol-phosphate dehydratase